MPDKQSRISRRAFLQGTAAVAGAVVAGSAFPAVRGGLAMVAAGKPQPVVRNPLYVPPTVFPGNPYSLTAAPATVPLGGGKTTTAWVYSGAGAAPGRMPGPTFQAWRGDTASIILTNGLSQETITHWHGMIVDHANDGHPMQAIQPGGTRSYSFQINQRAALNWYHPHPHMLTGEQVVRGLAGAFIVRDAEEAGLGLPSGAQEVPLVLRDADFDRTWNLDYHPRSGGFLGNTPLVNGTLSPTLSVTPAVYRFRVLNGANSRIFGLALSTGAPFTLIGNDGGLLETPVSLTRIDMANGERLDLIVDFRGLQGSRVMLKDLRSGWDLLEFAVQTGSSTGSIPTTLSTIADLSNPVTTREFAFESMSRINGLEYDMNRIDFTVPRGQTELWRFTTKGNAPHPVHVHGASFQVKSRTGGRGQLFPWEAGWKDTVLLEDGEIVEVLIRFDITFPGEQIYLLHCHKLEHEDMGMMTNFKVV